MPPERCCIIAEIQERFYPASEKMPSHRAFEFSSGNVPGQRGRSVNGVAMANPGKAVIVLGSERAADGGDTPRQRVCPRGQSSFNIKLLIDDNNVEPRPVHPQEIHGAMT